MSSVLALLTCSCGKCPQEPPLCACGCAQVVTASIKWGCWNAVLKGHNKRVYLQPKEAPPLCACGCGNPVTWGGIHRLGRTNGRTGWNEVIVGHAARVYWKDPSNHLEQSTRMLAVATIRPEETEKTRRIHISDSHRKRWLALSAEQRQLLTLNGRSPCTSRQEKEVLAQLGLFAKEPFCGRLPDGIDHSRRLAVEYLGDYFHCNPKYYKADYFNKRTKRTAQEIWKRDDETVKRYLNAGYSTLLIWASATWSENWLEEAKKFVFACPLTEPRVHTLS